MSQRYAPETELTILRLIRKGTFTSEADVIDRAVQRLDEKLRLEELRESIEEAFPEFDLGDGLSLRETPETKSCSKQAR